ncbi:hypothetical protein MAR_026118, partial [Mya arenaria]
MTETPINRGAPDLVLSTRRESILRTSRFGTPYRTPNVRRFGPTGATWRTSAAHSKTTQLSARRTSTPLNTRTKGQRDSALTSTPLNPRAKRSEDETFSQITSRTEIEENNIKHDSKALLIQIKGKKRYKTEEKVLCEAVLFSTDLEYNPLKQEQQSEFTYFSTALIHGPVVLSETLQNWLEPLDLVYGIPAEVKGISQIDYSTQAQDCLRLWK